MIKLGFVGLMSLIFLVGATPATKVEKKAPEVPRAPKAPAVKDVIVDTFEASKTDWQSKAMEFKEGAREESNDLLKLSLNTDAKYVKSGKKSLKVEYAPVVASTDKFAILSKNSDGSMGGNTAISFWVYVVDGTPALTVDLFDNISWKKCTSSEIPLNFKGWKKLSLSQKDFSKTDTWDKINVIQLSIKGKTVIYLDDISFTK